MQDWIERVKENDESIVLKLQNPSWLDTTVFEKMEVDESCLRCHISESQEILLSYHVGEYVSLKEVLSQYWFEDKQGYQFLLNLLQHMMACSKNKPVLADLSYVFVNPYGHDFKWVVIPICIEKWMNQKEQFVQFVQELGKSFQTHSNYEIPGFIDRFILSDEFSLMNLYLGIQALYQIRFPKKRFSFRRQKDFEFEYPLKKSHKELVYVQEEAEPVYDAGRTQVLGTPLSSKGYFMINHKEYPIVSETTIVGRSMSCDIRLQNSEVSAKHAKVTCLNDRYYIQDLHSRNGTFLEQKRVQRKMRLKHGMKVRFGNVLGEFYES